MGQTPAQPSSRTKPIKSELVLKEKEEEEPIMWAFRIAHPTTISRPQKPLLGISSNTSFSRSRLHSLPSESRPFPSLSVSSSGRNHLIQTLSRQGDLERALQLLSQEPNPTQRTFELLLLACTARNRSLREAWIVHQSLVDRGFDQDPFLATKLINVYSHFNSIDDAIRVFDDTSERTIYVWNALIRAFVLAGRGEGALLLCRNMYPNGIDLDRFTYPHILKACCVAEPPSVLLLRVGKEIHGHILRRGFEFNIHVSTTLVDVYAKFGCVGYARRVFDKMALRNVVSWSAVIACYAKNGRPSEALDLFSEMMEQGNDAPAPNSVTMVNVLQSCGALAALGQGKVMHAYILRRGLDSILSVSNALLSMYAKSGSLETGRKVFDQILDRDVVSWNSMVSGYSIHGLALEALHTFEEMVSVGVSPTNITFVSVLGACSHMGLVEEGKRLFVSMTKNYDVVPSDEHYACMVDLLGRAGQLDEAVTIIETMQSAPGPTVWGSLLGVCRIHGNVELAERASSNLFELEPTNAGNYVLMADVYAESNMWEDVDRVRRLLEARELEKVAGCSWIEVRKRLYSFVSVDELNPQMEQLHALLVKISMEMKGRGYVPNIKVVLYDLGTNEKEEIVLGHSEKLAVAFGLINTSKGETIRITKNLRLCEDCHTVTKFISKFANREIFVRDVNRFHHFKDGVCSCGDYW